MRDTIFVSHSNPEDNEFSLWLTLQLASQGYPVWCDLTRLLGGEDFWSDIEDAIRHRTVKFLYVLSRSSNHKPGVLQELSVAKTVARSPHLHDFIIPLKLDDLPHSETNIQLHNLNAVSFNRGWALGLKRLIEKLEEDGVAKSSAFSPTAVSKWWRSYRGANQDILSEPEDYLTNWFPIGSMPETIHFHHLVRSGGGVTDLSVEPQFPAIKHGAYLISFASLEDLRQAVPPPLSFGASISCPLTTFLKGEFKEIHIEKGQARKYLVTLLRQAWELAMAKRELPVFALSGGTQCFYFTQGMVEQDRVFYTGVNDRPAYRQVVGFSTVGRQPGKEPIKRYWHFGLQLKPLVYPVPAFAVKPHVLFSSDGRTIWDDAKRLHRARRSECKNWWNAEWRDRILASMTWLVNDSGKIIVPLGSGFSLSIAPQPLSVTSPVSYRDPEKSDRPVAVGPEDPEDDFDDEDDNT